MTLSVPVLGPELMGMFTGLKLFGMQTLPRKIGDVSWYMQIMRSTKIIKSECCRRFAIYGHPELIFLYSYCHWSFIVLHNGNGKVSFPHSREGMTQGDPPYILNYVIEVLPTIK